MASIHENARRGNKCIFGELTEATFFKFFKNGYQEKAFLMQIPQKVFLKARGAYSPSLPPSS